MVLERKRDGNSKNRKSDMWCEAIRSKKQRGVDGHVGHKGVFRQDGKKQVVYGGKVMF